MLSFVKTETDDVNLASIDGPISDEVNVCSTFEKVCNTSFKFYMVILFARDWTKSTGGGVDRIVSKCGVYKTHDPPLLSGTKLSDPPLNEG